MCTSYTRLNLARGSPLDPLKPSFRHKKHNNKNVLFMNKQKNAQCAQETVSTTRIHLKLKKTLKAQLEEKAASNFMSLSQLLLQSARSSTITIKRVDVAKNSKELLAMTAAYNKFGAQLNMIAKHCNTFKESSDTPRILIALIDIERGISELKASLLGES